jgi:hypothetical protein
MGSVKTDKTFYSHEKLCNFFYSEALAYCTKVLAKQDQGWSLACETNGYVKRLILKSRDRCGYLSLFINRTSIKATAVARNRWSSITLWEYLRENGKEIVLADFDKYVPKRASMKHDFADVIKRMNALIDYTVAGFEYTGWTPLEHVPNVEQTRKDLFALQDSMKEMAHQPIIHYGVHTKKEYNSMVNAMDLQDK